MLKTGFGDLDRLLGGGFQLADAVVLAGNTGTGKSSLALQMLLNVSQQVPVADFSLEMSKVRMVTRALAQLARLPIHQVRNPQAFFDTQLNAKRYADALQEFRKRQGRIFFDCTADLTIGELCLRIEKLVLDRGVKFVVVDHIGKLTANPNERFQNREREIAYFSWKLTQLAIKHEIVVLSISPLNKEAENFTQPGLGHMRDSGMISYDARTVLLLSNPLPDLINQEQQRKATLQIAKQGDGESGVSIELSFHGNQGAYFGDGPISAEIERISMLKDEGTSGVEVGHGSTEFEAHSDAPF
jgi:replicative DNA helicase